MTCRRSADPLFGLADVIVKIAVDIQSQHKLHTEALVDFGREHIEQTRDGCRHEFRRRAEPAR